MRSKLLCYQIDNLNNVMFILSFYRLVDTLELVLDQYGTELPQLAEFPSSIKLNQAVATWKHIVYYYAKRH